VLSELNETLRVVIVDDEEVARRLLKLHLSKLKHLKLVGEANNGLDGVELINKLSPDLAFLDVEMPDISGFDLLPHLENKPIIIFCTSHDHYAFKAFEAAALDFLLKPVESERLVTALSRAREQYEKNANWPVPNQHLRKIISHDGHRTFVVWVKDVVLIRKDGRYTEVHSQTGEKRLSNLSLDSLEQLLPPSEFFRINRKVMVRNTWIAAYQPAAGATGELELIDGEMETVSRSRWKEFKAWFQG